MKNNALLSKGIKRLFRYNIFLYGGLACFYLGISIFEYTSLNTDELKLLCIYPMIISFIILVSIVLLYNKRVIGIWIYYISIISEIGFFIFDMVIINSFQNSRFMLIEIIYKVLIITISIINSILMVLFLWKNKKRYTKIKINEHYL